MEFRHVLDQAPHYGGQALDKGEEALLLGSCGLVRRLFSCSPLISIALPSYFLLFLLEGQPKEVP